MEVIEDIMMVIEDIVTVDLEKIIEDMMKVIEVVGSSVVGTMTKNGIMTKNGHDLMLVVPEDVQCSTLMMRQNNETKSLYYLPHRGVVVPFMCM